MKTPKKILTPQEQADRLRWEGAWKRSRAALLEGCRALISLHDSKVYKSSHGAWDHYCKDVLGVAMKQAFDILRAARVMVDLDDMAEKHCGAPQCSEPRVLPGSIRAALPLGALKTPEDRYRAFNLACTYTDGQPSTRDVQTAVQDVMDGLSEEECEYVRNGTPRAAPTRQADGKPLRTRRIETALSFLYRARDKLSRVEDVEDQQEALAELIAGLEEVL